ncbi:MAG: DUF5691 domain-containing protein, partial [Chloroflexota bacterium]
MDAVHMDAPDTTQLAITGTVHHQTKTTAADVLTQLATARLERRVAWQPPALTGTHTRAEGASSTQCSEPARRFLVYILQCERDLLLEWLLLVAVAGQHAPHEYLPVLMAIGETQPPLRIYLWHVIGARGRWLEQQYPTINWVPGAPHISVEKLPTCQHWRDANTLAILQQTNDMGADRNFLSYRLRNPLLKHLMQRERMWSEHLSRAVLEQLLEWMYRGNVKNDRHFNNIMRFLAYHCPLKLADFVTTTCANFENPHTYRGNRYYNNETWHYLLLEIDAIFASRRLLHASIHT